MARSVPLPPQNQPSQTQGLQREVVQSNLFPKRCWFSADMIQEREIRDPEDVYLHQKKRKEKKLTKSN